MRIDGEPWKQPLPVDDDTVLIEISHLHQVKMLAAHGCKSKSVQDDPSTHEGDDEEEDSNEDDDDSSGEERKKFGAADTFKIPDGFDMSRLS